MRFLILLAFVSSCGPLKMDTAKADGLEAIDTLTIAYSMLKSESCDQIYDFLQDTALEHNIDESDLGCN